MRSIYLVLITRLFTATTFASGIREFDLKALEKLGNELTRVS